MASNDKLQNQTMTHNRSRVLRTLRLFKEEIMISLLDGESRITSDKVTIIERRDIDDFIAYYQLCRTTKIINWGKFCKEYVMRQIKPI